jgi:hypothetical protein
MVRTSNTVPAKQQQPSETVEDSIARGGVSTPFPFRLHEMLDWSDAEGTYETNYYLLLAFELMHPLTC